MISAELSALVGDIDIYLFDQLLRGRFDTRRRVLDAGCGAGRNLVYLLGRGFDAFAIDSDPAAVAAVKEMWRVLVPGGLLFARLATSIGLEHQLEVPVGRVRLPDGSERFVVDEATLLVTARALGGRLVDPLKTTNVQQLRAMTTWVLVKE